MKIFKKAAVTLTMLPEALADTLAECRSSLPRRFEIKGKFI